MELRVLIHAPRGRDGAVVHGVLTHQRIEAKVCATDEELLASLREGAAAVILTEEALPHLLADDHLLGWLQNQPPWSWCCWSGR
jgi:hypothetical protein